MATHNNYNDFGALMVENRDFMVQLEADDMTRNEWKKYVKICDSIASTSYKYLAEGGKFEDARSAIHGLFEFIGVDTRILAIDVNAMRIINLAVPFKVVKSDAYKEAEKALRKFKQAKEWACEVSKVDENNPDAILFPKAENVTALVEHYFSADEQDNYNLCVGMFKTAIAEERKLKVADLATELTRLEGVKEDIAKLPKQYYNDYIDPTKGKGKKPTKHVPFAIRKRIEDATAMMLSERSLFTPAQLDKEEAQIKGGKKQEKKAKEEAKAQESK